MQKLHHCLEGIQFGVEELEKYMHFEIGSYTRNLVHRNSVYELMVICWGIGHHTPIHDHNGQEGWIRVMQGEVEESLYKIKLNEDETFSSSLIQAVKFQVGGVSHVNDQIAYHSIRNTNRGRSVTIHLYSLPINDCHVYDTKSGKRGTKIMKNYTEYGRKI